MSAADRQSFDRHMMAIALMMARRGLGLTAPNPSVGAVIADETTGEVIARAVTAPGGRPHAETIAIAAAGARARGATIYVTLEPCSHFGRTGPCADAIIAAGLKRAVVAIEDPDPRVAGRGLDRLRQAGVEVVRGVGASEARFITRGHIVRVTERRPFVTAKIAVDAAGNVPRGSDGRPTWVTGVEARARGHLMRARADAVLVGAGTVIDDDPELTCRLPGLFDCSATRVVLSRDLRVPIASRLVQSARQVPLWCVAAPNANPQRRSQFEAHGGEVIEAPLVGGMLWLPAVMEALVARGVTRLLVEGGAKIWRAFGDAALVDEVQLFVGGAANARLPDNEALKIAGRWIGPLPLLCTEQDRLGPDRLWRFTRLVTEGR